MKKFTKILALALAVAMMLGTTALAGTPTKIVIKDDYSDATTISAFATNSMKPSAGTAVSKKASTLTGMGLNRSDFEKGEIGYNRWYFMDEVNANNSQYWPTLSFVNGKGVLTNDYVYNEGYGNRYVYDYGYLFDEPFTFDYAKTNRVGLVSRIMWTPLEKSNPTTSYDTTAGIYFYKSGTTEGKAVALQIDGGFYDNTLDNTNSIVFGRTKWSHETTLGTTVNYSTIFRPYNHQLENTAFEDLTNFYMLTSFDGDYDYYPNGEYENITGRDIQGIAYPIPKDFKASYSDYLLYEISLDGADLYIKNETNTGKLPKDKFVVKMSQPLSSDYEYTSSATPLVNGIKVIANGDAENPLVYGTDYTVELSEEVSGTEIYGVITIAPINDWKIGTTYSVVLPDKTCNIARTGMAAENNHTATFATIPAPAVSVSKYFGLEASGSALTGSENMAGKTVYVSVSATNSNAIAVNGKILIGVYDADGNLVKYATSAKGFAANGGSATFGAAFKIEAGQTISASYIG